MFLGYDEVAHHSGIERPETLRELAKIDKAVRAARQGRRGRTPALPHRRPRRSRPVARSDVQATLRALTRRPRDGEVRCRRGARAGRRRRRLGVPERCRHGRCVLVRRDRLHRPARHQKFDRDRWHRRPRRRPGRVGPQAQAPGEERRRRAARGDRDGVWLPRPDLFPANRRARHARATQRPLPRPRRDAPHPPRNRFHPRPLRKAGRRRTRARAGRTTWTRSASRETTHSPRSAPTPPCT